MTGPHQSSGAHSIRDTICYAASGAAAGAFTFSCVCSFFFGFNFELFCDMFCGFSWGLIKFMRECEIYPPFGSSESIFHSFSLLGYIVSSISFREL